MSKPTSIHKIKQNTYNIKHKVSKFIMSRQKPCSPTIQPLRPPWCLLFFKILVSATTSNFDFSFSCGGRDFEPIFKWKH